MVWIATAVAVVTIAQQIASKAVRDGLFLTEFEVTALPYAMVAGAVLSFFAAIFLGRLMSGFSPAVAVPVIFGVNALVYFGESAAASHSPALVAGALYLHTAAFGGAVVSGFWSVINERFDPYTARRVMGRIAGGATVGGMLGGALTWALADLPIVTLLMGLGAANVLCGAAILRVAKSGAGARAPREPKPLLAGFGVLAKNRYPRTIAMLVFGVALMTATVDYVFKAGVTEAAGEGELVGFFAMFYTGTGVLTFLLQAIGSRRALRLLGVAPTIGLFPVVTLALLAVALVFPSFASLVALRGSGMVVENSLYRSGYELLYTAVPRDQKRSAKILIDLGCDRLGTAASSGLALVAIAASAAYANQLLLVAAVVFAAGLLGLTVLVRREYVASLARQIRSSLGSGAPDEAASMQALASTFVGNVDDLAFDTIDEPSAASTVSAMGLDRDALLAEVEARAEQKRAEGAPPRNVSPRRRAVVSEALLDTPLRAALREAVVERGERLAELVDSAPGLVGQLTDALLSARESVDVRVLAAELLAEVPGERAVSGLRRALSSASFRVRRAAALALLEVTRAAPALRPRRSELASLGSRELRRPARPDGEENAFERSSPFRTDARGNTIAPSLELALLLLAIDGDAEELRIALTAVTSTDSSQRGTGLEYLDNLLPGNLRQRILGLAEHPERAQASGDVGRSAVEELAAKLRAGEIGIRELRQGYQRALKARYDEA